MSQSSHLDVSVVLPFNDDEDVIGTGVSRLASHLRESDRSFEIIAVDEYSGDNSHAVLGALRSGIPELRVVHAGARNRGFDVGSQRARGRVLWLIEPPAALAPLAPFGRAYRQIAEDGRDVVIIEDRFTVARREPCLSTLDGLKGHGVLFQRRLARRAARRRLGVHTQHLGGSPQPRQRVGERPLLRLIGALAPQRAFLTDRDRW